MDKFELRDKIVLVAGASSGIGAATVELLLGEARALSPPHAGWIACNPWRKTGPAIVCRCNWMSPIRLPPHR